MPLRTLRVGVTALATGLLAASVAFMAQPANAHGAVSDPVTRAYDCNQRWQSPSSPGMQAQDPMCYQAYQADANAMYNWNGLFREGVAGRHQAVIPDGTLCSGGLTQSGRYAALDVPGRWNAVNKPNNFTLRLNDPSSHGADYLRIYITRQGFDPLTQKLTWGALELVTETGRQAPSQTYTAQVNAGNRTGRHIVYTIWQASHLDQSYYACSDVIFGGGGTDPTPGTPTPGTPTPGSPTPSSPSPSNPVPGGCTATVQVASQWQGGYQAEVRVQAGSGGTRGWTVSFAGTVQQGWNATFSTSGSSTVATNVAHNGTLAPNGTASFGFLSSGTPPTTAVCTAA